MVSIMKSLGAFDELIEEVSTHKITFAARASIDRLKDATEDLRKFFNENPGDRIAIQHKYNKANTYALQVEYFLCMYNVECNRRYKERENAKALYELARQLLYEHASNHGNDSEREYFLLMDYVGIAQKYFIAVGDFIIDMDDSMKKKVEEMSKYLVGVAKTKDGVKVEEYSATIEDVRKNEEKKSADTDNNEKSVISENAITDAEIIDRAAEIMAGEEAVASEPVRSVLSEEEL